MLKEMTDFSYKEKGRDALLNQKHSHNSCYEVIHILNGDGSVVLKDKIYPMKKGCIYFINGMDLHYTAPRNAALYERSKIVVDADFIDAVAKSTDSFDMIKSMFHEDGGLCISLNEKESARIDAEFLNMKNILSTGSNQKLNIALSLFNRFQFAKGHTGKYTIPLSGKIAEILHYINQNIDRKLSLYDICQNSHISKYYLCHTFREHTQMSISEYILFRRISMAKKRLLYTDISISEIAMSCGFSSFAYFSKVFRESENCTPLQYRKGFAEKKT